MNFKRLFYYLVLNIIISAATILVVLNIWDRSHNSQTPTPEPVSLLPTVIASVIPITETPSPTPNLILQPYEVGAGETLSEIALLFDTSVDQLLEINNLSDPDELTTGMVLAVPAPNSNPEANPGTDQASSPTENKPIVTSTTPSMPENERVKIVTIVGVGDLATEHIQIQSVHPEALSLEGWRVETNNGQVYTFPKITLFEYGAVDLYSRAGINSVVALYWGRSTPVFQSGDQAVIYDAEGNVQAVYSIP